MSHTIVLLQYIHWPRFLFSFYSPTYISYFFHSFLPNKIYLSPICILFLFAPFYLELFSNIYPTFLSSILFCHIQYSFLQSILRFFNLSLAVKSNFFFSYKTLHLVYNNSYDILIHLMSNILWTQIHYGSVHIQIHKYKYINKYMEKCGYKMVNIFIDSTRSRIKLKDLWIWKQLPKGLVCQPAHFVNDF